MSDEAEQLRRRIRTLWVLITVNVFLTVLQLLAGYVASSLSLMGDAAMMFVDVIGYAVSLVAEKTKTPKKKKRADRYGAIISFLLLAVTTIIVLFDAMDRLTGPDDYSEVDGRYMIGFTLMNLLADAFLLHVFRNNVEGATLVIEDEEENKQTGGGQGGGEAMGPMGQGGQGSFPAAAGPSGDGANAPGTTGGSTGAASAAGPVAPLPSANKKPETSLNMSAALAHLVADILRGVSVLVSGLVIYLHPSSNSVKVDAVCSFFVSIFILAGTFQVGMKLCYDFRSARRYARFDDEEEGGENGRDNVQWMDPDVPRVVFEAVEIDFSSGEQEFSRREQEGGRDRARAETVGAQTVALGTKDHFRAINAGQVQLSLENGGTDRRRALQEMPKSSTSYRPE